MGRPTPTPSSEGHRKTKRGGAGGQSPQMVPALGGASLASRHARRSTKAAVLAPRFCLSIGGPSTSKGPRNNVQCGARQEGGGGAGLCLKGGGVPPNAPPSTLPKGTYATPIPPPPAFPTASDCPPTDFTARPNRFVTALSLPLERPPLQANPWGGGGEAPPPPPELQNCNRGMRNGF